MIDREKLEKFRSLVKEDMKELKASHRQIEKANDDISIINAINRGLESKQAAEIFIKEGEIGLNE